MNLPPPLSHLVAAYTFSEVTIGASSAATYRLECPHRPTIYLKIDQKGPRNELQAEKEVLIWLSGKLPVPEVLYKKIEYYMLLDEFF